MSDKTDGCSGGISWFYKTFLHRPPSWEWCCDEHDVWYYDGGHIKYKLKADWIFFKCLWEHTAKIKAIVIYLGVSIFGYPSWIYQTIKRGIE